jgi:putative transcriptional regulator
MKTKIREMRILAQMTQQQLADLVRVSSRTIISIEKEQYSPSLMLAYRIATVFGVSVEELCCLEENRKCNKTHNKAVKHTSRIRNNERKHG